MTISAIPMYKPAWNGYSKTPQKEEGMVTSSNLEERKVLTRCPRQDTKIFPKVRALTGIDVAFVCNEISAYTRM